MESAPSPTEEIKAATRRIEDMIGQTDLDPEHLDNALHDAQEIADKYEFTEGDEDFDAALDILVGTIANTRDLEDKVESDSRRRVGESED